MDSKHSATVTLASLGLAWLRGVVIFVTVIVDLRII